MQNVDCLIVGQGIAGTLCAHELEKRVQSVLVIDAQGSNASRTAAGMINPVVLKRFSPVWQGKEQIAQAHSLFAELTKKLKIPLIYPFDLLRIFHNDDGRRTWYDKAGTDELTGLLSADTDYPELSGIQAPHGLGLVHLAGRMDLRALLTAYRSYLLGANMLLEEEFDYEALSVDECCHYQGYRAKRIIFCEGYGVKQNPYFQHLPLNGNKGEVLVVKIPGLRIDATVKSSVFIMPLPELGEDMYFIGSTYNWTEKDTLPTAAARQQMLDKLKPMLSEELYNRIEIVDQRAGMRPTVSDRRPLLGCHPQYPHVAICNGLGTRGVMLGASMVPLLMSHLFDGSPLPHEVDIARFA